MNILKEVQAYVVKLGKKHKPQIISGLAKALVYVVLLTDKCRETLSSCWAKIQETSNNVRCKFRQIKGITSITEFMVIHNFTTTLLVTTMVLSIVVFADTSTQYKRLVIEAKEVGIIYEEDRFVKPNTVYEMEKLISMTRDELDAVISEKLDYANRIGLNLQPDLETMNLIDQPAYLDKMIAEQEVRLAQDAQMRYEEELRIAADAAEQARIAAEKAEEQRLADEKLAKLNSISYDQSGNLEDWIGSLGLSATEASFAKFIIQKESSANPYAGDPSGSYGLCQATPGYKMQSAGSDWETNPYTQMKWCNGYVMGKYGSWEGAYLYWIEHMSF